MKLVVLLGAFFLSSSVLGQSAPEAGVYEVERLVVHVVSPQEVAGRCRLAFFSIPGNLQGCTAQSGNTLTMYIPEPRLGTRKRAMCVAGHELYHTLFGMEWHKPDDQAWDC